MGMTGALDGKLRYTVYRLILLEIMFRAEPSQRTNGNLRKSTNIFCPLIQPLESLDFPGDLAT